MKLPSVVSAAVSAMWDRSKDRLYRAEIERRFRERTPPLSVLDWRPEDRVQRGEMRSWAVEHCGELPPETDRPWLKRLARWYRAMAKRIESELAQ